MVQSTNKCDALFERSTSEIYESSPYFEIWNKVFDSSPDLAWEHPIGYGPSKGFYIILHSFEASKYQRISKDFLLSLTNEQNAYDIVQQSFTIKPGLNFIASLCRSRNTILCSLTMNLLFGNIQSMPVT